MTDTNKERPDEDNELAELPKPGNRSIAKQYPFEYSSWCNMKARCTNQSLPSWPRYGGRGIKVCFEWTAKGGFSRFMKAMGPKPSPEHSIDRIDNNGDYTPGNCRWATRQTQAYNREIYGVRKIRGGKFQVRITYNDKSYPIAVFEVERDAARCGERMRTLLTDIADDTVKKAWHHQQLEAKIKEARREGHEAGVASAIPLDKLEGVDVIARLTNNKEKS